MNSVVAGHPDGGFPWVMLENMGAKVGISAFA